MEEEDCGVALLEDLLNGSVIELNNCGEGFFINPFLEFTVVVGAFEIIAFFIEVFEDHNVA